MNSKYFYFYKEVSGMRYLDWFTENGLILHLFQSKYYVFNVDYAYIMDYDDGWETYLEFKQANIKSNKLIFHYETRKPYEDSFVERINIANSPEEITWFVESLEKHDIEIIVNAILDFNKLLPVRNILTERLETTLKTIDNSEIEKIRENIYFDYDKKKFDLNSH